MNTPSKYLFLGALAATLVQLTFAQAGNPTLPRKDEVLELSPFQVNAEKDVGYQGGNTTSGSRLDASLKDTPAAITVFTPEFLSDLGATSLADVIAYGPNAETNIYQYTSSPQTAFFGGADTSDTYVVIRGLPGSKAADYFDSGIKIDLYNVERIEQASGPNSILFGLGSPGGLINSSTKRAKLTGNRTSARLQVGSGDLFRGELDYNQVLVSKKLGFRLNGLRQRAGSWRKFLSDDSDRIAASVQWKPSEMSALTVNYETGDMHSTGDRMYNAFDSILLYDAGGSIQESDAQYNAALDRPRGVNRNTTVRSTYATNPDGSAATAFYSINATGRRFLMSTYDDLNTPITVPRAGGTLLSAEQLPFEMSIFGPQSYRKSDFDRVLAIYEHRLTRDISLELAYNHEHYTATVQMPTNGATTLFRDPNTTLPNPNGSTTPVPNPNVGRYYVETRWGGDVGGLDNDVLRTSASWKLDLGKWGRHSLAGLMEYGVKEEYRSARIEIMVDANNLAINNAANPNNANNILFRRQYITPGDYNTYVTTGPDNPVSFVHNGVTYHSQMSDRAVTDVERVTRSGMVVTQSSFLEGKLILTGGIRRDDLTFNTLNNTNAYNATDPAVIAGNAVINSTYFTRDRITQYVTKPVTSTYGGVYHINKLLSVFYNHGTNVGQPPQFNQRKLSDFGPLPTLKGETDDSGFMLNLMEGKLFLRATAYQTALVDSATLVSFTPINKAILDGLLAAGRITEAQYNEREFGQNGTLLVSTLSDSVTKGIDLAVSYNPSRSLTLQANFSYSKIAHTNIAPEIDHWLEDAKALWYSTPGAGSVPSGNPNFGATIDDNVARMNSDIAVYRDGIQFNYGQRPYKANASGRYSFQEGKLKGVFVGGGMRWQSSSLIGRTILTQSTTGSPVFGDKINGPEAFTVDAFLGYRNRIKIGKRVTDLTWQLNISNATDEPAVQVLRYNGLQSGYSRVVITAPRQYKMSVSLAF